MGASLEKIMLLKIYTHLRKKIKSYLLKIMTILLTILKLAEFSLFLNLKQLIIL